MLGGRSDTAFDGVQHNCRIQIVDYHQTIPLNIYDYTAVRTGIKRERKRDIDNRCPHDTFKAIQIVKCKTCPNSPKVRAVPIT